MGTDVGLAGHEGPGSRARTAVMPVIATAPPVRRQRQNDGLGACSVDLPSARTAPTMAAGRLIPQPGPAGLAPSRVATVTQGASWRPGSGLACRTGPGGAAPCR